MKTKKVVVGAIAATMFSLSVCSVAPAVVAADETVQISVATAEVKAGEQFVVDVSIADIPSAGIQGIDFSINFDPSLVTIDSITAGNLTQTGADDVDSSAALAPLFDYSLSNEDGYVSLVWSTSLDDATYRMKGNGTFCTIKGTVSGNAAEGAVSKLEIVPTVRETYPGSGSLNAKIVCGYSIGKEDFSYAVSTTDGSVKVLGESSSTPIVRGDANCDGSVNMADAVLIMQSLANPDRFGVDSTDAASITAQGALNADVVGGTADKGGDGVTNKDALQIQMYKLNLVTEL